MKITIIIPFYNTVKDSKTEKFLQQNINSIINQTYKNIEVLYINNNSDSDDTSQRIIEDKTKNFINIKILQEKQQGVSHARNKGIKEATGDYFTFIDSDDFVELDYIEEAVRTLTNKKVDMLIGMGGLTTKKDKKESAKKYGVTYKNYLQTLSIMRNRRKALQKYGRKIENIYGAVEFGQAIFFKTSFIHKINLLQNTNITIGEDTLFNNLALLSSGDIKYFITKHYFYENNIHSASRKKSNNYITLIKAMDILLGAYIQKYGKINKACIDKYFRSIKHGYDKVYSKEDYKFQALSLVRKYNLEIPKGFRFGKSKLYKFLHFYWLRGK